MTFDDRLNDAIPPAADHPLAGVSVRLLELQRTIRETHQLPEASKVRAEDALITLAEDILAVEFRR